MIKDCTIRNLRPTDYESIISVVNGWWGGRHMRDMLPKLFFVHFNNTSFVVEHNGDIIAFLIGFKSQTLKKESYIHFAGVHPNFRKNSLGNRLYARFFETSMALECDVVRCVTSPVNKLSIGFHLGMGFSIETIGENIIGIPRVKNYDGPGEDRVLLFKKLRK